jgi:hypothetical protein
VRTVWQWGRIVAVVDMEVNKVVAAEKVLVMVGSGGGGGKDMEMEGRVYHRRICDT